MLAPALAGVRRLGLLSADPGAHAVMRQLRRELAEVVPGVFQITTGWAREHDPGDSLALAPGLLAKLRPDCLFLGACTDFALTGRLIRECSDLGITSVLLFDAWKNWSEHFLGDGELAMPDFVCLPDAAAERMLERALDAEPRFAGKRPGRTLICGQPALEADAREVAAVPAAVRDEVRRSAGGGDGPLAVLFLDPIRSSDGLGYDVSSLVAYLGDWIPRQAPGTVVLVKPHPRQPQPLGSADFAAWDERGVPWAFARHGVAPLVAAADEVWGSTSVVLVLARLCGKVVKSFQPGRTAKGEAQSNPYLEEDRVA